MPNDLLTTAITTAVVTIITTVIANQLSKSSVVERIAQLTGNIIAKTIKLAARFGVTLGIIGYSSVTWYKFGTSDQPIGRGETLFLLYISMIGFSYIGWLIRDIEAVSSGKRPL